MCSGLIFVEVSLMARCRASADDAHALSSLGGDNIQDAITGRHCQRHDVFGMRDVVEVHGVRIPHGFGCFLEGDAVLPSVCGRLFSIPFEVAEDHCRHERQTRMIL